MKKEPIYSYFIISNYIAFEAKYVNSEAKNIIPSIVCSGAIDICCDSYGGIEQCIIYANEILGYLEMYARDDTCFFATLDEWEEKSLFIE